MERFAEWKDEQHEQEKESFFKEYRKEILDACIYDFEQKKQQWIDKACEFWKHKFPYIDIDIIKEFVDTMKGE